MTLDVAQLRAREFPWAASGDAIFLNAASTGPLPERTIATLSEWARLRARPDLLPDHKNFGTLARSRELIARLIGASAGEIALAVNTSYGMNLAARALPLGTGHVVLTPDLEFPANVYPWAAAASDRGFEYRRIPLRDGVLDEDALLHALEDDAVRCVSLSWVGFANGFRADLARISDACRARNVFLVVDAMQGLGVCPLDVATLGIDILACGAQKWLLGPWGAGFVYVKRGLIERLDPPMVSWMAARGTDDFRKLTEYDFHWRDDARRYEFITLPFQDFAGMNASLELFEEIGMPSITSHITALADEIVAIANAAGIPLVTPGAPQRRAGIVSVRPPAADRASARLKDKGITHSFREGAIRLSPHIYNTIDDVRYAMQLIAG
ncbi:MAG TPA: aminotransferase class V-fold PLP-dependent enzyme [Gemmatimonadaceae bacterium]|nr:aminotransferase class V-fold PLP-dependent enzyme [Gemmatimonadaceae bacterium]